MWRSSLVNRGAEAGGAVNIGRASAVDIGGMRYESSWIVGNWEESEKSEESESLLELLLDKDISIRVRICKRVGSEEKEGVCLRRHRASEALNTAYAFIAWDSGSL